MHRGMIGRIEKEAYIPAGGRLKKKGEVLRFETVSFF
jgi:hypothetical protein